MLRSLDLDVPLSRLCFEEEAALVSQPEEAMADLASNCEASYVCRLDCQTRSWN